MAANQRQIGGTHYKGKPIEHWDFVLMHNIPYMEAQIMKYVMRWRDKNGVDDLRKAMHFLEKLIEWQGAEVRAIEDVRQEERAMRVWQELSIAVSCTSPDGSAEIGQVKYLQEQIQENGK